MPQHSLNNIPSEQKTVQIHLPEIIKKSYEKCIDELLEIIPPPKEIPDTLYDTFLSPSRRIAPPGHIHYLIDQFDPTRLKNPLFELKKKYESLLFCLQEKTFHDICKLNGLTTEQHKLALKHFLEKLQLIMMFYFSILIQLPINQNELEQEEKALEEKKPEESTGTFRKLYIWTTESALLVCEFMEGDMGGTSLTDPNNPVIAIVNIFLGLIFGGFNYYMRRTTEILPQHENERRCALPLDAIHRSQLVIAKKINHTLQNRSQDYDLNTFRDYFSFANLIHQAICKKNDAYQPIIESRPKKVARYILAGIASLVNGSFRVATFSAVLTVIGITVAVLGFTFTPVGWVASLFLGLGIGIACLTAAFTFRQMRKNFKKDLYPELEESQITVDAIKDYRTKNHSFSEQIQRKIIEKEKLKAAEQTIIELKSSLEAVRLKTEQQTLEIARLSNQEDRPIEIKKIPSSSTLQIKSLLPLLQQPAPLPSAPFLEPPPPPIQPPSSSRIKCAAPEEQPRVYRLR